MGFIRSCFSFILGAGVGVYVAQNYNIPNIKKMADLGIAMSKRYEESYRKHSSKMGDDDDGST